MPKAIICLGAGIEGVPIIRRVVEMGHRAIVLDANPAALGMALADVPVVASCYDANDTVRALVEADGHYDAVLCAAVDAPHVAAIVAEYYDLPGLTRQQAALSVDKLAQKGVLQAAGLPVPAFAEITQVAGWPAWGAIVKPVDSRGARGVIWSRSNVDLYRAFRYAKAHSPTGRVMVEFYTDGPQLSTESTIVDGRALFTAVALRNYEGMEVHYPHLIENGFDMPYGDGALLAEVNDVIERGCAALGWTTLTCKADLIVHQGAVVILELAARLSGGFLSTHGTALAYGYDLVGDAIRIALGQPLYVAAGGATSQCVSQRYVFAAADDIGRRVISVPEPPADVFATFAVRPGDVLRPVTDHGARLGQALATGSTPEQARALAEQAVAAMYEGMVLE